MQLIDSSERADTLLSKSTGVGFEPVTSMIELVSLLFVSFSFIDLIYVNYI